MSAQVCARRSSLCARPPRRRRAKTAATNDGRWWRGGVQRVERVVGWRRQRRSASEPTTAPVQPGRRRRWRSDVFILACEFFLPSFPRDTDRPTIFDRAFLEPLQGPPTQRRTDFRTRRFLFISIRVLTTIAQTTRGDFT